ncbi:MAG: SCO1664 family protein [Anaerolineae bacterium]
MSDESGRAIKVVSLEQLLSLLAEGEMESHGLLPWASNYTFLVTVRNDSLQCLAVYKPQRGERPLWDFPRGTLCLREVAAYLVSEGLGWSLVPPTVLRDGPHGLGMVQLFIDADPEAHYFTLREEAEYIPVLQRIAVFDHLVNNADRKSGHCLRGKEGQIWALDHGVTFHAQPKLRTVIWDFAGQPIPEDILRDLRAFQSRLSQTDPLLGTLWKLLSAEEIRALRQRLDRLLRAGTFPQPGPGRHVPWPLI